MPDPTLDDLRSVLREHADRTRVPDLPLLALEEDLVGRRRAQRQRVLVVAGLAAAAAAVVVVGAAPHLGGRGSDDVAPVTNPPSPTPTSSAVDLPRGAEPKVAYAVGSTLHYPGPDGELTADLGGEPTDLRQAGDVVAVTFKDLHFRVFRLGEGDISAGDSDILDAGTTTPVVLSADGKYVAWVRDGGRKPVVIVSRVIGTETDKMKEFPYRSGPNDPLRLVGFTTDGRLIAWQGGEMKTWAWDFAHDAAGVVTIRGISDPNAAAGFAGGPGVPVQVVENQLVVASDGGAGYGIGPIGADGTWHPELIDPVNGVPSFYGRALFGPDGKHVAYFDDAGKFWVYYGSTSWNLIDADRTQSSWAFEDAVHLLITTAPDSAGRTELVRCTLTLAKDGYPHGCEKAASIAGDVLLPRP